MGIEILVAAMAAVGVRFEAEQVMAYQVVVDRIGFAGLLGWGIGRWFGHLSLVRNTIAEFRAEHGDFIGK